MSALVTTERNAFEQYAEAVSRNRIVGELLKFSKGDWLVGKDGEDIAMGTRLVAAMDELMVGWLKWENSKPVDMRMGRVIDGHVPEKRAELGDTDAAAWETDDNTGKPRDPWQLTNYLIMKDETGDQLYTFAPSSSGGISEVGRLSGVYGKTTRQRPDEFPIVALGVDSYMHSNKAYGRIKTPVLKVVGWTGKATTMAAIAGEAAEAEAAAEDQAEAEAAGEVPYRASTAPKGKAKTASDETRF